MSYRLTATEKWDDNEWFRKLSTNAKVLFFYLTDKCDIAGFIKYDIDVFSLYTGIRHEDVESALNELEHFYIRKNGWIWIKNFLKHQKNLPLNESNHAHRGIIRIINNHPDFVEEIENHYQKKGLERGLKGATEGLYSPPGKGIGIGIGIGLGKDKKEGGAGGENQNTIFDYLNSLKDGIDYHLPNINDYEYQELLMQPKTDEIMQEIEIARIWIVYRQEFPLGMSFKACRNHILRLITDNSVGIADAWQKIRETKKITGKQGLKIWEVFPDNHNQEKNKQLERKARMARVMAEIRKEREEND